MAAWELFIPSHFQAETWHFVIVKEQSLLLAAIKKFHNIIIPSAIIFFLIITYSLLFFLKRLMSPLKALGDATSKISKGSFNIELDINSRDEFKELGDSFTLMAKSLRFQKNKDEVFSNLEKSVLISPDIHMAIKENIFDIARLFGSNWVVLTIIDPLNDELMHSHCCSLQDSKDQYSYTYLKHGNIKIENDSNEIYSLSNTEFRNIYQSLSSAYNSEGIWCKKLLLNNDFIGICSLGINSLSPLSKIENSTLIEFSERFSTIYTTHEQGAELYYKAHYDSLTSLPNRSHLLETLNRKWPVAIKDAASLSIFFIDLDNFKNVNDLSGHKAGNQVLSEVARRLKLCIKENSLLARLSGDEFCILHQTSNDSDDIEGIAKNIIEQMQIPFEIKDMSFFLGASVGIALEGQITVNHQICY